MALNQGEYAIFHLQFRVGDGDAISKEWQALGCLEKIHIPYATWDGTASPSTLASSLPLAQSDTPSSTAEGSSGSAGVGQSLRASFNQRAIRAHYADFIERGEEAYLRSHYGDARANMARDADKMMEMMGEMLLGSVAQAGNTDVLVQRLRNMDMHDLADKLEARGQ